MENNRCPGCMEIKSGAVCEHCGFDESRKNAPHQLQIGTVLQDKYLVGRTLGQGGFGITYLGWNRYLDTKVAIKEYYPSVFVDRNTAHDTTVTCRTEQMEEYFTENRIRFLREAKVLAKLKEVPQIVSILDFFEANNTAYIVMEYLQGYDLKAYIRKKGGRLSPTQTFNIMRPVMAALAQVHEAGLVHRDISPDNIMLQPDGSVKLMDFGAVRSVHNAAVDKKLTEATQTIVKHGFAPMEQYSATGAIGPWTDEYALCATMYYCMTGEVPQNVHDRLEEDKDVDWDSIEGLTEAQREILRKGIALRAKDRYRSIREMMDALFAPQPKPKKRSAKSKRGIAILAATVCAVLALAIVLASGTSRKTAVLPTESEIAVPSTESVITAPSTEPEPTQPSFLAEWCYETISTGGKHTVGLKTDGTVVAVGGNNYGQCDISGWKDIVAISAGSHHTVGLKTDGTVQAVGLNKDSQCDVSDWSEIVAISAGGYHTVGLKADGTVVAVGLNEDGQCDISGWKDIVAISADGDNTMGLRADGTVVAVGNNEIGQCEVSKWSEIVAISAGWTHTVGLKADGTVVAVGYNSDGQCNISGWRDIVAVSAGAGYTVGLKADGTVVAVGSNEYGQCKVSDWSEIVAISAGGNYTIGLKADGTVVAVGLNYYGQCNVSDWRNIRLPNETVTEPQLEGFTFEPQRDTISAGGYHTVTLKADGSVMAVGDNAHDQCEVSDWREIVVVSAGEKHTVGLKADGTVVAVGDNDHGQCNVSDWKGIVAISAGEEHTVGLKADGTVVAAGSNGRCDVSGWSEIIAISAGYNHTSGLKADGTVVAVGDNDYGQCNVSDWKNIVAISAGENHTVGLKADGTVIATGYYYDGRCDVSDWSEIVAISAGGSCTVGLKADGTVVATEHIGGYKIDYGQSNVSGWSEIVAISAGKVHTLGLKADGTVVAVGANWIGQCNVSGWRDIRLPQKPKETS